ncbi:MAG: glucose-6-phosphate isomerase family protein [Candidatus Anstonellales archaeon]
MLLSDGKVKIELLEEDFRLFFDAKEVPRSVRTLGEMEAVAMDKNFFKSREVKKDQAVYYMYRGLREKENIRYDLTVIPPFSIGMEFVKTFGHYHPKAVGDLSYCEVYEVLSGNAHYLLQLKKAKTVAEVALVKAAAGDLLIIPPNWGHVTINPSKKILVMANLVNMYFDADYAEYKKMNGAVYFEDVDGRIIFNRKYVVCPPIRIFDADSFGSQFEVYPMLKGRSLLDVLNESSNLVSFLDNPNLLR